MRKLIRPSEQELKQLKQTKKKKSLPSYETHSENYYYLKQINNRTPMVIVFLDGEEVRGVIDWYDAYTIKIRREGKPNLMVFKHAIKYIYKDEKKLEEKKKENQSSTSKEK